MKRLYQFLLVCVMIIFFISCERSAGGGEEPTPTVEQTTNVQSSPIKGIWECQLNGVKMTFNFGDSNVEYKYYIELYNATATYKGTYTIQNNNISLEFTSLTTKNSSGIEYYAPDKMPKEAELKDEKTILYIDNIYKRK